MEDPFTMKNVNLMEDQGKYDCRERILYINHEKATPNQINELISKSFEIHVALKDFSEVKEQVTSRFSRMGAFGMM